MNHLLFLCTGNYYRSQFCEEYFNHQVQARRLSWRADSRGLAPDITMFCTPRFTLAGYEYLESV